MKTKINPEELEKLEALDALLMDRFTRILKGKKPIGATTLLVIKDYLKSKASVAPRTPEQSLPFTGEETMELRERPSSPERQQSCFEMPLNVKLPFPGGDEE